jgi:hypothetical protein
MLACRETAALEGATEVGVAFSECGGSDFGSQKGGRKEDEKTSRRSKHVCFKLNGAESCYEVDMDGLSCSLYIGFCRPQVLRFLWSLISSYTYSVLWGHRSSRRGGPEQILSNGNSSEKFKQIFAAVLSLVIGFSIFDKLRCLSLGSRVEIAWGDLKADLGCSSTKVQLQKWNSWEQHQRRSERHLK